MDFYLTQEQEALRDSVARFCEREYDFEKRNAIIESALEQQHNHWATFAELGWLGAGLSEELGGFGGGPIENAVILEQFGKALVVEPFIPHIMSLQVLTDLAASESAELVEQMVAGERRVALAHFEAHSRGNPALIDSIATFKDGRYHLKGRKTFVQGAAHADGYLISAQDNGGVSLFYIDADHAGIERQIYRGLDNHLVADLSFDDVTVDQSCLVGTRGKAAEAIEKAIDYGIIGLCAEALGAIEAAMLMTRDYLKTRQQFGTTLNKFQALQHRMADMLVATELSRSMLYQGLAALEQASPDARKAGVSATKVQFAQSGLLVGSEAIQLHGGIGVTEECAVGHYYKRLFVIAQLYGNVDYHLDRFAGL